MNIKYINPFIKATVNVFKQFLGTEITADKPYLYNPKDSNIVFDASAIIGLAGEVIGVIVLSFPKISALKITSKLIGVETKIFDENVTDAIGEIVNIVAGNAKKDLEDFKIVISLPSIVKGVNHNISWMKGVPVINIPFKSEFGEFYLFVSLKDLV